MMSASKKNFRQHSSTHDSAGRKQRANTLSAKAAAQLSEKEENTQRLLRFLRDMHDHIRQDEQGDYFYEHVSATSVALLLTSELPPKELLWQWYQHFQQERGQSIYATLSPFEDETLLDILMRCEFACDYDAIRTSGLLFLPEHRQDLYVGLSEFLEMRLEDLLRQQDDHFSDWFSRLKAHTVEQAKKTLRRQFRALPPLEHRLRIYQLFPSAYLRATARALLEESSTETFWRKPPHHLQEVASRFTSIERSLLQTAKRLNLFSRSAGQSQSTRAAFETPQEQDPQRTQSLAVLELSGDATAREIRAAYRKMAKTHHPDQGGGTSKFLEIQAAYEYLLRI